MTSPIALLHTWSLASEILSKQLDPTDLPGMAVAAGFQGVEWLDRLMPSFEPAYWDQLAAAQKDAGLDAAAFSLSLELNARPQALAAQKERAQAILGLCPRLGVKAVRVSIGGGGGLSMARLLLLTQPLMNREGEPQPLNSLGRGMYRLLLKLPPQSKQAGEPVDELALQSAAWSLQPLARQAASLGISLGLENHFGLTSHARDMLTLLDLVNQSQATQDEHEHSDAGWAQRSATAEGGLGVCLDTGNHPDGVDPAEAARLLAPRAVHVHWKLKSNPPSEEERANLRQQAEALSAAGYAGMASVEYQGPGLGLEGAKQGLLLLREMMG